MELKTGAKTTEFWISVLPQALGFLVLLGIVPSHDVDDIVKMVTAAISGIMALISLISYIRSRIELKKAMMTSNEKIEIAKVVGEAGK